MTKQPRKRKSKADERADIIVSAHFNMCAGYHFHTWLYLEDRNGAIEQIFLLNYAPGTFEMASAIPIIFQNDPIVWLTA